MTDEFAVPDFSSDATPFGLNPDDEKAFVESVLEDLKTRRELRKDKEATWKACWKAYHSEMTVTPTKQQADRNQVARPIIFQAVENLHNTIMSQLFPKSGRFFHVFGQGQADQEDASRLETLLHHKLATQDFQSAFGIFLKQLLVTGNSVMMMPWHYEHGKRLRQVPIKRLGLTVGYAPQEQDVLLEQGPRFDVLNIQDVYIDETVKDWREGTLIRRISKRLNQVLQEPRYIQTEAIAVALKDLTKNDPKLNKIPSAEQPLTLIELWGDVWINGRSYENHVAVVVEETGTLIRFEPHGLQSGQAPFVFAPLIPVPHEGYGIGAVEKSLGLQHAINALTNQKLDILNLCINSPFTYLLNDDVFDPLSMDYRPGALIAVKNHDTLRPLPLVAQNITVAFQEIEDLKIEVMETSGSLRLMTGALEASNSSPRTATEVNTISENAHRKYDGMLMQLEQDCLEPMLQLIYELSKQFWIYPEELRFIENQGSTARYEAISPEVFQRSCCDIRVLGSRGQLKEEQELESILFFLKTVQSWPELLPRLNMDAILKRIIRNLGFRDEELLRPADEPTG
jgi:hypothetical protein